MKPISCFALLLLLLLMQQSGHRTDNTNTNLSQKREVSDMGILILQQTQPGQTGGTDAILDQNAPKEITSTQMMLFDVTSVLPEAANGIGYVSAFAAPADKGTFLFLETGNGFSRYSERRQAWALVREDVFPRLVALTAECNLAEHNGYYSETHGLPENFGGSICIQYTDGEKIRVSDNQSPVISSETGARIAALFAELMDGERVPLPELSTLRTIRFEETRDDGGFTRATLTISGDGSGKIGKSACYSAPTIYESESELDAAAIAAIKDGVDKSGILAWEGLPDNGYRFSGEKCLTFVFTDGTEIEVPENRLLPDQIQSGFFDIEMELAVKH
ncbi:MAG: hypothetical protein IKA78_05695 [Oscillospiraceae bacterium]|nr:hypothetical protein [Oscillospiraceae bacterium]MBR2407145.1 hypothetical protein [Clostridia bacterium]